MCSRRNRSHFSNQLEWVLVHVPTCAAEPYRSHHSLWYVKQVLATNAWLCHVKHTMTVKTYGGESSIRHGGLGEWENEEEEWSGQERKRKHEWRQNELGYHIDADLTGLVICSGTWSGACGAARSETTQMDALWAFNSVFFFFTIET